MPEKKPVSVEVPIEDPDKVDESDEQKQLQDLEKKAQKPGPDGADEEEEDDLSEEDRKLKEDLEMLVKRVTETKSEDGLRIAALNGLREQIRTSTSSMTSIPKPLKFLRPHYEPLKQHYATVENSSNTELTSLYSNVLSILAMTMSEEGSKEMLNFVLKAKKLGSKDELGAWGHEFVRSLAGEIGSEWDARTENDDADTSDLSALVDEIIPFHITHHAETDAIDLLIEIDQLRRIVEHISKENFERVCVYIATTTDYALDQEDKEKHLRIVYDSYIKVGQRADALRIALKLDSIELAVACFKDADTSTKNQLGFIMGAHRASTDEFEDDEDLAQVVGNEQLSWHFLNLARELDVVEAKTPDDIYKSHLADGSSDLRRQNKAKVVDSAKQNLASTFVNAFVNAGFGKDKLISPDGSDWLYKNKDHGMFSAAASLGLLHMWDLETGFSAIDKYAFSQHKNIKAGALLATGIIGCGVTSEMDASLALLSEHLESSDPEMKTAAVFGLGIAYVGTAREDVLEALVPILVDTSVSFEIAALAALSLGMVYVGTANDDLITIILEAILDRSDTELDDSMAKLVCLGMGLLLFGKGEACEPTLSAIEVVSHQIKEYLSITIQTCAYAGTGNVLAVQKLLAVAGEHIEDDKLNQHQGVAVFGLAAVAMGEKLGAEMVTRCFDHILQYGEVNVRRAIPLALSLLSVSNPDLTIMDTLSKLSHDSDQEVSQNACLALGIIGAGTNNSRIANMLRQLASYYAKEANHLFLVRIAQGLLHMGKGLLTLSPFHSDNLLVSKVAFAGLFSLMHTSLDLKNTILSKRHYLLYALVPAIRPRSLICVNEELEAIPVKVRVGQGVDTVGVAGKPRKITGFQTHTTPVLLSHGDRAELATDEYIPLTSTLEGFVVVKKNPDFTPEED